MISSFIVLSSTYSFIFIDCLCLYCYVCVILYSAIQLFSLQLWLNVQFSSVQRNCSPLDGYFYPTLWNVICHSVNKLSFYVRNWPSIKCLCTEMLFSSRPNIRQQWVLSGQPGLFLSRVSTLTHDIDIAILSVRPSVCLSDRDVPVLDGTGLTYCHRFFNIR